MVKGLSKEIKEALNRYYLNRQNQSVMDYSNGVLKERGWNKAQDLENIFAEAKKEGWSVEAVAGHFWFSMKLLRGRHVIEVMERNLPEGGISNIKEEGEPFGALVEIADALRKTGREPFFIRNEEDVKSLENTLLGGDPDA
jgi:hypothetical protein